MSDSHAADVQAELQQYLNSKNINALFIAVVESLLIEKPANPIAFIIEYLYKQYPDQAKVALDMLGRPGSLLTADAKALESKAEAKTDAKKTVPAKKTAKDDTDSDSDDDVSDLKPEPVPRAAPKPRRVSVSSESVDPAKLKAQRANITSIPKSPEVETHLLKTIKKSPMLKTLDNEQRMMLVNAFSGPIEKEAGEDIIVQGEIGDVFYLLEEGVVDVYIRKPGSTEEDLVHTYKPGDSFGELAIMYNAPRAATCKAQTNCKLWTLDRVSFKVIVVGAVLMKREQYHGFLKQVPILETLSELEVNTLADSMQEETHTDGTAICTQGEEGDMFYIIKEGKAVCSIVDATGTEKVVATLEPGRYFGEIALLTAKPRQATVRAQGTLTLLAIDRATFRRVFGHLDEILKRNMDHYVHFTASTI